MQPKVIDCPSCGGDGYDPPGACELCEGCGKLFAFPAAATPHHSVAEWVKAPRQFSTGRWPDPADDKRRVVQTGRWSTDEPLGLVDLDARVEAQKSGQRASVVCVCGKQSCKYPLCHANLEGANVPNALHPDTYPGLPPKKP